MTSFKSVKEFGASARELLGDYYHVKNTSKELGELLMWLREHENKKMESFQVTHYDRTIEKATLQEEIEGLFGFMEEVVKKMKGDKNAEDFYMF
jgi:hypothetical protein